MLTDKQVRSLKSLGKDTLLADGAGLYVRVSRHGSKTFLFRSREGGKARYMTLGEYPELSLSDARTRIIELGGKVTDITVKQAVAKFITHIMAEYEDPEQVKRRLEVDVVPELGEKRLSSVTAADVSSALQKIVDRGSPVAANRTLADVKHVFQYAYGKGWIRNDPTSRITRKVVGGREKSKERVVSQAELKALIEVMSTDRFELRTRVAIGVIMLTGQRASEVLGISKKELNGAWWTIPGARTKSGRDQKVYLTHVARWLLRKVDYTLGGDHRTLSRALKRMKVGYTPHDLRRTMATILAEAPHSIAPHVVEKMLGHQMEGVMNVYNRAEYLEERKHGWKVWSKYLLGI